MFQEKQEKQWKDRARYDILQQVVIHLEWWRQGWQAKEDCKGYEQKRIEKVDNSLKEEEERKWLKSKQNWVRKVLKAEEEVEREEQTVMIIQNIEQEKGMGERENDTHWRRREC